MKALLAVAAIGLVGAAEAPERVTGTEARAYIYDSAEELGSSVGEIRWCKHPSIQRVRCLVSAGVEVTVTSPSGEATSETFYQWFHVDVWPRKAKWSAAAP